MLLKGARSVLESFRNLKYSRKAFIARYFAACPPLYPIEGPINHVNYQGKHLKTTTTMSSLGSSNGQWSKSKHALCPSNQVNPGKKYRRPHRHSTVWSCNALYQEHIRGAADTVWEQHLLGEHEGDEVGEVQRLWWWSPPRVQIEPLPYLVEVKDVVQIPTQVKSI